MIAQNGPHRNTGAGRRFSHAVFLPVSEALPYPFVK